MVSATYALLANVRQQEVSLTVRPRLFLITPAEGPSDRMVELLGAALSGGDVASLLIDAETIDAGSRQSIVKAMVKSCHDHDVAALVLNDTQLAGRAGADGVHVDTGLADLETVVASFKPRKIVGVGGIGNRHDALLIGDLDVDYVLFGQLDRIEDENADPSGIAMAEWWSPIIEIPCISLAGKSEASLEAACETGAEFVAIRSFAWSNHDGPADAIRKANDILDQFSDDDTKDAE